VDREKEKKTVKEIIGEKRQGEETI